MSPAAKPVLAIVKCDKDAVRNCPELYTSFAFAILISPKMFLN
jgi:hypothetical protein